VGEGSAALAGTFCIVNPQLAPGSFHFEGPNWLLDSAEGLGERSLDLAITSFVQPMISSTTTAKPGPDDVSEAVGYSVTLRFQVQASSGIDVPAMRYQRLEAYTSFQKTVFEIRDITCSTVLGLGSAYRPIGVHFETRDAFDVAMVDVGIYTIAPAVVVPLPVGPGVVEGVGGAGGTSGAGGGGPADAGAGD
jgi:hypothetical protein